MKMNKLIVLISLVLSTQHLSAQIETASNIEKMRFFEKVEGEWEGVAFAMTPEGQIEVKQHEKVEYKLNGTILTVEGTGRNEMNEIVFHAYGIMYYDAIENAFKIKAFKDNGQVTLAEVEIVKPGEFIWSFSPNPYTHIRYHTKFDDTEWIETGEYSADKVKWVPIFSMSLTKK
jgi:hypothetical protein